MTQKSDIELEWLDVLAKLFPNPIDALYEPVPRIDELSKNCLFVFDTNALLKPYMVGTDSCQDIIRLLKELASKSRFYVPAQALREFGKNRTAPFATTFDHLSKLSSSAPQKVEKVSYPFLEPHEEYGALLEASDKLNKAISDYKKALNKLVDKTKAGFWDHDEVTMTYRSIIKDGENVITCNHSHSEIEALASVRYGHKLPPGYKDQSKPDGGLGDLKIWYSILSLGISKKANVIFVTDDAKADWVLSSHNHTLIPRPELTAEYYVACKKHFSLVNFSRFLQLITAKPKTIQDAITAQRSTPVSLSSFGTIALIKNAIDAIQAYINVIGNDAGNGRYLTELNIGILRLLEDKVNSIASHGMFNSNYETYGQLVKSARTLCGITIGIIRTNESLKDFSSNSLTTLLEHQRLIQECNIFIASATEMAALLGEHWFISNS